jgi:endonuclease/exonuclease/phosphatase family metal-dependent hydrolase
MKRILLFVLAVWAVSGVGAENITVATFNVWSGLTYRGFFSSGTYEDGATREFRYDLLASGLRELSPDIVALQEGNPLPSFAERIAGDLGYDQTADVRQGGVRIGPVGLPTNLREGSVILADTNRSLNRLAVQNLVGPGAGNVAAFQFGPGSQVVAAQIEVEERPVYVFTTRWTPSPPADTVRMQALVASYVAGEITGDELTDLISEAVSGTERRQQEARRTLTFINELAGENPVILMGSFYSIPDSPEIDILRAGGFTDVWQAVGRGPGVTYDPQTNTNITAHDLAANGSGRERYDYIFIRGSGIVARSAQIIFSQPTFGVHASDHYGILAELRVDPAE